MPFYPYACPEGHQFEVVKSISDIDRPEVCDCGKPAERYIARTHHFGAGDWNRPEFNHGLGCVTKGWRDAEKIAKARGLEPVGSTAAESISKEAEQTRQAIRQQHYADAARMKV